MDHVLGPWYSTCLFSIGTRVVLQLGVVSFLHWTMCHIFIGLLAISYLTMYHGAVRPCFVC